MHKFHNNDWREELLLNVYKFLFFSDIHNNRILYIESFRYQSSKACLIRILKITKLKVRFQQYSWCYLIEINKVAILY